MSAACYRGTFRCRFKNGSKADVVIVHVFAGPLGRFKKSADRLFGAIPDEKLEGILSRVLSARDRIRLVTSSCGDQYSAVTDATDSWTATASASPRCTAGMN